MSDDKRNAREKAPRGFGVMHPDDVKRIAGMGGKAAHAKGTAYTWSSEEARAAGRKGGLASRGRRVMLRDPFAPQARSEGDR